MPIDTKENSKGDLDFVKIVCLSKQTKYKLIIHSLYFDHSCSLFHVLIVPQMLLPSLENQYNLSREQVLASH